MRPAVGLCQVRSGETGARRPGDAASSSPMTRLVLVGWCMLSALTLHGCASTRGAPGPRVVHAFDVTTPNGLYSAYAVGKDHCALYRLGMAAVYTELAKRAPEAGTGPEAPLAAVTECYPATLGEGGPLWAIEYLTSSSLAGLVLPTPEMCAGARSDAAGVRRVTPCFPVTLTPRRGGAR